MNLGELLKHVISTEKNGGDISPGEIYRLPNAQQLIEENFGTLRNFYVSLDFDANEYMTPLVKINTIRINCGLLFEEIMADLLREVMPEIERHRKFGTLIPDFTVGNKIIDAKLTQELAENEKSRTKYEPLCEKLILVFLTGYDVDYMINDKTRIVRYDAFYEPLRMAGKEHLIDVFEKRFDMVRNIAVTAQEQREDYLGGKLNDEK